MLIHRKVREKAYLLLSENSEKVGLDLPYFIKGGFWLSVNYAASLLKAFILSVLFANILSKAVFGEYSFIMAVLNVAGVFALPGMANAIIRAVARGYEGTYRKAVKEVFKWSWLGSLFLLGFSVYEHFFGRFDLSIIFIILSSFFPFYSISGLYIPFFNGKSRFDLNAKLSVIYNSISAVIIGITVFVTRSAFWITIVTVLIQILIQGGVSSIYVKRFIKKEKVDKNTIKFGKSISASMAFAKIADVFDSLLIAYFLGFKELAAFKIITLVPNQIKVLANAFTPMILPKMASKDLSKKQVMKHFKKFLFITVALIIAYLIGAPFIFKWFYPKYYSYVWLSIIYHFSFISFVTLLPYTFFIKEGKQEYINKILIIMNTSLIVLSIIFIYKWKLVGA
ncbi:oligosaccharide flippase family protein, partial [Candidatus Woesearchaeota archaeon]|nr:oligosaccharide flippase family protein [Candidatus Woesearchaeota archaeon]